MGLILLALGGAWRPLNTGPPLLAAWEPMPAPRGSPSLNLAGTRATQRTG